MAGVLVLLALGLGLGLCACASDNSPEQALSTSVRDQVPRWAREQGFQGNREALAGANLFADSGCTGCHTYLGSGSTNLGAPDLSAEGAKGRGIPYQTAFLKCPSCLHQGSQMPPVSALSAAELRQLAVFLEASKGKR